MFDNKSVWKRFAGAICVLLLCLSVTTWAQEQNSQAGRFSASELDTLVSTIALYPDPLLVHVLAASTYGEQIPGASAWAESHKQLKGEELARAMENADLKYDPCVQALIPFPTVLATMAKYRDWSDQLGDAVSVQKEEVMDAIQRMRSAAYDHGQLQSNDQVVVQKNETIIIEPTRTEYVYVPVYNPHVVYYVHAHGYPAVRYGYGVWLGGWYGEWGWGSCWFEWDSHFIYVRDYRWYYHRPIPHHPRRYSPPPRPRHGPLGPKVHHDPVRPGAHMERPASQRPAPQSAGRPLVKDDPNTVKSIRAEAAGAKTNNLVGVRSDAASKPVVRDTPRRDDYWEEEEQRRYDSNKGFGKATAVGTSNKTQSGNRNWDNRNTNSRNDSRNSGRTNEPRNNGRGNGGFGKAQRR